MELRLENIPAKPGRAPLDEVAGLEDRFRVEVEAGVGGVDGEGMGRGIMVGSGRWFGRPGMLYSGERGERGGG